MKYRPEFPDRFGGLEDSCAFGQHFFPWYNDEHRHSGIGMMTPAMVHFDLAPAIRQQRQTVSVLALKDQTDTRSKDRCEPSRCEACRGSNAPIGTSPAVPRGTPPRVRKCVRQPSRLLFVLSPGLDAEGFLRAVSRLPQTAPPEPAELARIGVGSATEFAGPPLSR